MGKSPSSWLQTHHAAKRMYARVLSQWAIDLIALRRDGLDRPVSREGSPDHVTPSFPLPSRAHAQRWPAQGAQRLLSWRSPRRAA
jgi:hypothetical protein